MDNLDVHSHEVVDPVEKELDFDLVLNVMYVHDFNLIERSFHMEEEYMRKRLQENAFGKKLLRKS